MKLARFVGQGAIAIHDEAAPSLPEKGLLVQAEASGLCSGELMDWYMERKIPHVLGHEVAGRVIASEDSRFPVGSRVAPHHHAPCLACPECASGRYVHCDQWKRTKLLPGGMAEVFAIAPENLIDTHRADNLRAVDAALLEPLACVVKSVRRLGEPGRTAVIGLGAMGLLHMLLLSSNEPLGLEQSLSRRTWAESLGLRVAESAPGDSFDSVVVCPGTPGAIDLGFRLAAPGATILMFAPLTPGDSVPLDWNRLYFEEISLVPSYSAGPDDMAQALRLLEQGKVRAEQVVSDFIGIEALPQAYAAMKAGEILKAMVVFE